MPTVNPKRYHYDLHAKLSDDPSYRPGETVCVLDAQGEPIPDVIAYDQRSGRLDHFASVDGKRTAVMKITGGLKVTFPDREKTAETSVATAVKDNAEVPLASLNNGDILTLSHTIPFA